MNKKQPRREGNAPLTQAVNVRPFAGSYTRRASGGESAALAVAVAVAAAAAATVRSPSHNHRVVLREKVLLPQPSGLRSFPVNLHLIWFWFERNPGEDDGDLEENEGEKSLQR